MEKEELKRRNPLEDIKTLVRLTHDIHRLGFMNVEINGDVITIKSRNNIEYEVGFIDRMETSQIEAMLLNTHREYLANNIDFAFKAFGFNILFKRI